MVKKIIYINLVAATFLLAFNASAQNWRYYRSEVYFGLGASNFLGELGGADQIGTNFVRDLEFRLTRPAITAGYSYRVADAFALRGGLTYGRVNGDDALTNEHFRNNRNLNFRSPIIELAITGQLFFIREKLGTPYKLRGAKGDKVKLFAAYLFGGVGGTYFNPKGQDANGNWHALQPLSTEGQGLGGADPYSKITLVLPYGIGIKYTLNKHVSLGLELGVRKTFTDYIDDVSTVYHDKEEIRDAKGDLAAYFADPSLDPNFGPGDGILTTGTGMQRGDPTDNDAYMFGIFSIHYRFLKGRYNIPKF